MGTRSKEKIKNGAAVGGSLDEVAEAIAEICATSGPDTLYRVGKCIIERIYGSDIERWRNEGVRDVSYRHLAARADVPFSASALCRAVGVYALCERLVGRIEREHLTASHLQEVLPLAPDSQERLLRKAESERWSIRRLRLEVTKEREPSERRTVAQWLRALRKIRLIAETLSVLPPVEDDVGLMLVVDGLGETLTLLSEQRRLLRRAAPPPKGRAERASDDGWARRDSYIDYLGRPPERKSGLDQAEEGPSSRHA